jgi:hypothetical protein
LSQLSQQPPKCHVPNSYELFEYFVEPRSINNSPKASLFILGFIPQSRRLGIDLPRSVVALLSTRDVMMPDVETWGVGPAFLHELITVPPPPRERQVISTTAARIVATRGAPNLTKYASGTQVRRASKARPWFELER